MADNTPNFLGSMTPSETPPQFYYGYFSGLTPVEVNDKQQVVRFALPDLSNAGLEEQRRRAEYDTLSLYGVVDRNNESLKRTTTVNGMSVDTFVGMGQGKGLSESPTYSWYNPMGWYDSDTANRETVGEQEKNRQSIAGTGVRGMFGEMNREYNKNQVRLGNADPMAYPWDATTSYEWGKENLLGNFGSWLTGFGKQVAWIDTFDEDADYWNLENKLKAEAPNWNTEVAFQFTNKFLEQHQELANYLEASGINLHEFTRLSKNPFAFTFQINNAVLQASANRRMQIYEENTGVVSSTLDDIYYGLKDPTTARDMLVGALASYGFGGLEVGLGRLATTGFAARTGTAGALRLGEKAAGKFLVRGLLGGPMTGPIESLIFNTSKTLVPSIGHNPISTVAARTLGIFGEGFVGSSVGNIFTQKENYRFKHLALNFGPFAEEFKYDTAQILEAGYVGGATGAAFFGTLRGTLGGLSDIAAIRAAKPGEKLKAFSRNVANSLDAYAVTPEGRTIFGSGITEGRGIAFGNWFDAKMRGIDNRNTAGVIVNGKQLHHFAGFTPEVVSKANFNEAKAREIQSLWTKATNTVEMPSSLYDPEVLSLHGKTYDDVISTIRNYIDVREQGIKALKGRKVGLFEANRPYDIFKERLISKQDLDTSVETRRQTIATITKDTIRLEEERATKLSRATDLETDLRIREEKLSKENVDSFEKLNDEAFSLTDRLEQIDRDINLRQRRESEKTKAETEVGISILEKEYESLAATDPKKKKLQKKIQKLKKQKAKENKFEERFVQRQEVLDKLNKVLKDLEDAKEKIGLARKEPIVATDSSLVETIVKQNNSDKSAIQTIVKEKDDIKKELADVKTKIKEDTEVIKTNNSKVEEERNLIYEFNDLYYISEANKKLFEETLVLQDKLKEEKEKLETLSKQLSDQVKAKKNKGVGEARKTIDQLKKTINELEQKIKDNYELIGGDEGLRKIKQAGIVEDAINGFRGFGSAEAIETLKFIYAIESYYTIAEKNGVSFRDISTAFREVMGRNVNYGSFLDTTVNLRTLITHLIGKNQIEGTVAELQKWSNLSKDGIVGIKTANGAIISGARVVELLKATISRLDKRTPEETKNGPVTVYIANSDLSSRVDMRVSGTSVVKVTISNEGNIIVESSFATPTNKNNVLTVDKASGLSEETANKNNITDFYTFRGLYEQFNNGVETIIARREKLQAETISSSLSVLGDEMKVVLLDSEIASTNAMLRLSPVLKKLNDKDLLSFLGVSRDMAVEEFTKAKGIEETEARKQAHKETLSTLFLLDALKEYAKERAETITDAALKKEYNDIIASLSKDEVSVGEGIRSYFDKPEPKAKVKKEPKEGTGKVTKSKEAKLKFKTEYTNAPPATKENLELVFGFTKEEALVGEVVMKSLGVGITDGVISNLRVMEKTLEEDSIARIYIRRMKKGTRAIIAANKEADLFSVSHEMGHYVEQVFLHPQASEEARKSLGITNEMYDKLMTWLGGKKDPATGDWNVTNLMSERFADGFALYLQKLLNGDGKASNTGIQFLFNKLGEHVGDLGEAFKSKSKTLEADFKLTPEAEEIYAALLAHTSKDSITEIFRTGFGDVLKTLDPEQQELLGQKILGEMKWSDYKAKIEKERLIAERVTAAMARVAKKAEGVPTIPATTAAKGLAAATETAKTAETPTKKTKAIADKAVAESAATKVVVRTAVDSVVAKDLAETVKTIEEKKPTVTPKKEVVTILTLNEIENLKEGDRFTYRSVKSGTNYTAVVFKISEQIGRKWLTVEVTNEKGVKKKITKDVAWWFKNNPQVKKEVPIEERIVPKELTTPLPDKVAEVIQKETVEKPTPEKVTEATKVKEETKEVVVGAAEVVQKQIEEVKALEEEVVTKVTEEVKNPVIVATIVREVAKPKPNLSFATGEFSPELKDLLVKFDNAKKRNSTLLQLISEEESQAIISADVIRKKPAYAQIMARAETNPDYDIDAHVQRFISMIAEDKSPNEGKTNIGLGLFVSKAVAREMDATQKRIGVSVSSFITLIKGQVAQSNAVQKHLERVHADRLKRIETDLKEGKTLDSEDRAFIAKFKTNLDVKQKADKETHVGISDEKQYIVALFYQLYAPLLRKNKVDEELISHVFEKLLTSDNLFEALQNSAKDKGLSVQLDDPQSVYLHFEEVKNQGKKGEDITTETATSTGDAFYPLLRNEANLQQRRMQDRGVSEKKRVFGLEDEEQVIRQSRERSAEKTTPEGESVSIFDKTISKKMGIESSENDLVSQGLILSFYDYLKQHNDPEIMEFFVAKLNAMPEAKSGQYKAMIKRIWEKRKFTKPNGKEYSGDDLKALDKKLEGYVVKFIKDLEAAGQKDLAETIRKLVPPIKERMKKVKVMDEEEGTIVSLDQSIKRMSELGEPRSNKVLREMGLEKTQEYVMEQDGAPMGFSFEGPKASEIMDFAIGNDVREGLSKLEIQGERLGIIKPELSVEHKTVSLYSFIKAFIERHEEVGSKYIDYVDLLTALSKNKTIEKLTKESVVMYWDHEGRAGVYSDTNELHLYKNNNAPAMLHEIAHQLTIQFLFAELSNVLEMDVEEFRALKGNPYIYRLKKAIQNEKLNPHVANIVKAYLFYLSKDGLLDHLENSRNYKYTVKQFLQRQRPTNKRKINTFDFVIAKPRARFKDWETKTKKIKDYILNLIDDRNTYSIESSRIQDFREFLDDKKELNFLIFRPELTEALSNKRNGNFTGRIKTATIYELEERGLVHGFDFFVFTDYKLDDGLVVILADSGQEKLFDDATESETANTFYSEEHNELSLAFNFEKEKALNHEVFIDFASLGDNADNWRDIGFSYYAANLQEFIAGAFNDPTFIRDLYKTREDAVKDLPFKSDNRYWWSFDDEYQSNDIVEYMYEAITNMFNLEKDTPERNLLQVVLRNVEGITLEKQNRVTRGMGVISFDQKPKAAKDKHTERAIKFQQELKTAKGRWNTLARKLQLEINAEKPSKEKIDAIKLEMDNLLGSMSVRRAGLKALGLSEEFSDEDFAVASRLLKGLSPVDDLGVKLGIENANRILTAEILQIKDPETKSQYIAAFGNLLKKQPELAPFVRELKNIPTVATGIAKAADNLGREAEEEQIPDLTRYRDLPTEQRREFLINEMYPKIIQSLGDRAGAQNILSKFFESVPGGSFVARKFQGLAGGSVAYGDTANAPYVGLAFIAKIFDPNIDVRNGELTGSFRLPSIEEAEAEAKLLLTSSGLPEIISKLVEAKLDEEQLKAINTTAWRNLTKTPDMIPVDTPFRDLILELIEARKRYNKMAGEYYSKYGNATSTLDFATYGTSHRPSKYAEANPEEFVKALTKHEVNKFLSSNELNGATLHAMGWIEIVRSARDGGVDKVTVKKDSPVAKLFKEEELDTPISWNRAKKRLVIKNKEGAKLLSDDVLDRYYLALQKVTEDYLPAWRKFYKNFENPTAIFISMKTAKDRILRLPEGEASNKDLLPKTYFANKANDYTEERLFTHDELVADEELSKFYSDNVLGLTIEEANSRLFQHTMTKKLYETFGTIITMDDLLELVKEMELNYVRDFDKVSEKERESFFRGWEKLRRSWLNKVDRLVHADSDYDKNFRWLLDSSHGMMMALGGLSAGTKTVVSELTRATLASDRNKSFINQFVPNLINVIKYAGPGGARRRIELLKLASAIHWSRAVLEDTYSANYEKAGRINDYTGPILGRRGWYHNLATRWNNLVEANRVEKTAGKKVSNVLESTGWLLGGLLRWSNEMVNVISMHNALKNFGNNIDNFRSLATMVNKYGEELRGSTPRRAEFNRLCKACGIASEEALDLSRSGLLSLDHINILHKALKENEGRVTTEGLPDSAKLLRWAEDLPAGERELAKEAVYRMAGYIKTLGRNTNTEPTLLDNRITLDPVARMLRLYTQFGTSNSVQAIGRSRRSGNMAITRFIAGQLLMQTAGGLIMQWILNGFDDDETLEEISNTPVAFMIANAARMPVYGNYGWLFKLLTVAAYNSYAHVVGAEVPKSIGKADLPDLISSPFQYRFDTVTKDLEKMPGLFVRYMEGKPLSLKQKEQIIESIPLIDNLLMAGFIKNLLSMDRDVPTLDMRVPDLDLRQQKPMQQPRMPMRQPEMPRVATPVPSTQEPVREPVMAPERKVYRPVTNRMETMGVSSELADLLEEF